MRYEHAFYMTRDRQLDVEFLLLDLGTRGWRAYILSDINYTSVSASRSRSILDTHRLSEKSTERRIDPDKSYYYVCWNQTVRDLETMKRICAAWSEITAYYIQHGGSFPAIQKKLTEQGVI